MTREKLELARKIDSSIDSLSNARKDFCEAINEYIKKRKFGGISFGMDYESFVTDSAMSALEKFDNSVSIEINRLQSELDSL